MIRTRAAFSLVEILVVVAIIAVLVAVLLPVMSKVREKGRQATCSSNQYQLYLAMQEVVQDNQDQLPGKPGVMDENLWLQQTKAYAKAEKLWQCPSNIAAADNAATDYSFNPYLYAAPMGSLTAATQIIMFADGNGSLLQSAGDVAKRHAGGYIACFADGHREYLTAGSPKVIFADGDEGSYLCFGAQNEPITFTSDAVATGKGGLFFDGDVVLLVNGTEQSISPKITVQGGANPPTAGLIPGTSQTTLAPGQSRAFILHCRTTASGVKADTTYTFGENPSVSFSVQERVESPDALTSGTASPARN